MTGPPPLPHLAPPWSIRTADPDADLDLVHAWNHAPHVAAAWHQDWTREQWRAELEHQRAGDHSRPCVLARDGVDLAFLEIYRPARDPLAEHVATRPDDLGVHVAVGDPAATGRGLGTALLAAVADGLLAADPRCGRVLAEPDHTNVASVRAFRSAGFADHGPVALPGKDAVLLVRSRPTTTQEHP